jgi:predicted dehydrogenase
MVPFQRVQVLGTMRRVEIEIPFNAPTDSPTRIVIDDGSDLRAAGARAEAFETCDQYRIQGELFSKAIREGGDVPTPLEDSLANMAVIEAIFSAGN